MEISSVDIAGIGAVSAYGWGIESLWKGLLSGESAGRQHENLGGSFPRHCWFARVPEQQRADKIGFTRYSQACFAAAEEAVEDALARGWNPGARVGIVHATTRADLELMRTRYLDPESVSPRRSYTEQSWTTPTLQVMKKRGYCGPAIVASAACASGLHAMAVAQRLIACGDATDVIVVAADVGFDGEEMTLFASLGPLIHDRPPTEVCRPLQPGSRGFVLGEGAAALVLSGSPIAGGYAQLKSTAMGNDHYHPVSIEPSHRHIVGTVARALDLARMSGSDVAYYCAHATGTEECRLADVAALESLSPSAVAYGFKPMLGHCMGAAPLLDAVIIAKSYSEKYLPAPGAVSKGHPQLAIGPFTHRGGITVQLGLGFGGNISAAVYAAPTMRAE